MTYQLVRSTKLRVGLCALILAIAAAGLASVLASRPASAQAPQEQDVVRATLENGLRVVIVRNTLAPVIATSMNYLVGADETPSGFPGMAHAQEHMMFRGSPGLSADQLADIGSIMGGSFNADTRQTVTQYYYTVPAEDLDVALRIEALRMRDVLDSDADWQQERGAIEQEVAQDLSNPQYVMFTRLRAALFAGTPYEYDGLGTRPSFDRTTAKMLKSFYEKWYAPNNAIFVVVGDVDPKQTLSKIRDLFGGIPARSLPERQQYKPQPVKAQTLTLKTDLPYGMEVIALRMPGLDSPDYPALEVLSDVLSSERGALYELVPQGKALAASFSFDALPKSALGAATITYPVGASAAALEKEVRAILARIAKDGVSPDLVEAAKLQERREAEFEKNSIEGLATVWAEAVAVDNLQSPEEDLERIEKVTVADVNRVAHTYLDLEHAITAVLTPEGSGQPHTGAGFGGQESIALGEAKPTPLPDWASAELGRLSVPTSTVHPTVTTLPNGLTLIVQPESVSHTVSVIGHIRNQPPLQVPIGQEGLTSVLEQLFSFGSEHLDRVAFQQALDQIGAEEEAGINFGVSVLKEHFDRAVELLADNELHPALPQQAFEVVRGQVRDTVAGRLQSPGYLAQRALGKALYPKGDAALREALPQTVEKLTLADLRSYYRSAFRPDLAVIAVIGDVTPEEAKSVVAKYFGSWSSTGDRPQTTLVPVPPSVPSQTAVPDTSRVQDQVTLAQTTGLTSASPERYALTLGNVVLSGGFYSARLSRDLRKRAGLVYTIDSQFSFERSRGTFSVQYACEPPNVAKVQASVERELSEMQTTNVTDEELQRSKAMLLRRLPLAEGSTAGIAQGLIARWDLELPLDEPTIAAEHYMRLTAEEVRSAFAKWVRPQDLARVSLGPKEQ